jgi:SET domain-containing protein
VDEEKLFLIKKSYINGRGLFANKDFKKGDLVIPWNKESKYLSKDDAIKLAEDSKKYVAIYKGKYLLIASPERYLNHSCNPNVETKEDGAEYAIKKINKGEELTGDYTKIRPLVGFTCNCKSKNCKKIIGQ